MPLIDLRRDQSTELWIPDHIHGTPKQPGMWVARFEVWESCR